MSEPDIRLVTGEQRLSTSSVLRRYAFRDSPAAPDPDAERRLAAAAPGRVHVLFDADEPRATATVIEMTQNVRGAVLPMGGVAGVASHPQARRRGHARRLLTHLLADMRAQGQVVSALYPFRASFYEKFGYLGVGAQRQVSLPPGDLTPLLGLDLPGELSLHRYPDVAREVRTLTEASQRVTHGMALRVDEGLTEAARHDDQWAVLATIDDTPVGYLAYRISGYAGELDVWRWAYRDPVVRALLLSWLARHAGQVATARLPVLPAERPETWVPDADLRIESTMSPMRAPAPMVRILSVPGLSGMPVGDGRTGTTVDDDTTSGTGAAVSGGTVHRVTGDEPPGIADGAVSVTVHDELIGGTYLLRADAGRLAVTEVAGGAAAEAALTGHGLAALVYGVLDPAELPLRGFGSVTPAAVATLRALFGPRTPFLLESF